MKIAVLGAGRIGCGFLVPLLRRAGHEVVLVGRDRSVLASLRRGWLVRSLRRDGCTVEQDVRCEVVPCDAARAPAAVAACDVALVAVGTDDLSGLVPLLRAALRLGHALRDVVVIENGLDPAASVRTALGPAGTACGVSSGLVTRVVARREVDPASGRLVFVGDDVGALLVDRTTLRGALPEADGLRSVPDHRDAVRRKLWTFNAGHAAVAYLGAVKGYHYVHSAVADPEIAQVVRGVLQESMSGITARYGPGGEAARPAVEEHLERFRLPLDDDVVRVGRQPLRKLRAEDRLVAPARLALAAGREPAHLALVCAAALVCSRGRDRSRGSRRPTGPREVPVDRLREVFLRVSGQAADTVLARLVGEALTALGDPSRPPGALPVPAPQCVAS